MKRQILCGIYIWEFISPGKWFGAKYIGKSKNLLNREKEHSRYLRNDKHNNPKFQRIYNKYGKECFKFSILMECPEKELNFWEKWFIKSFDTYKSKLGLNLTAGGENTSDKLKKACEFVNIKTGEVVKTDSIISFSDKYNLNASGLSALSLGRIKTFCGWYCPKISNWKPTFYTVISPDNKEYQILDGEIYDFAKKHGVNKKSFCSMVKGKTEYQKGWHRPDSNINIHNGSYDFELIDPNGNLIKGNNIYKFAKDNNLDRSGLDSVVNGRQGSYKGWTNPKYNNKILFKIISPNNQIFDVTNIGKFAFDNQLHAPILSHMQKGRVKEHRGWKLYKETT